MWYLRKGEIFLNILVELVKVVSCWRSNEKGCLGFKGLYKFVGFLI